MISYQKLIIKKKVLDTTQHYKVRINGKGSNLRKGVVAIEKGAFGSTGQLIYNKGRLKQLLTKYMSMFLFKNFISFIQCSSKYTNPHVKHAW